MSGEAEQRMMFLAEQFETMVRIREFEERVSELFEKNELPGFVHLYIGQEAVAAGACATLDEEDYITSTHRGHGHAIAKGLEPDRMMAELFGKETGYCNGKSGSMHIADVSQGMLGANGIVGAGPPLAIGAGLSIKQQNKDEVCLSFFGDGAMAEGPVHEAMNLAGVKELPVVFICENNQYGEMTPAKDQHHVESFKNRGRTYGMPSEEIDGMDVEEVHEVVDRAINRARDGKGPSFVVCDTYRYKGHYEGDPMEYRTEEELEEWQRRDPITTAKNRLLDADHFDEAAIESIRESIEDEIDDAVDFARESDFPDEEQAFEDVYSEVIQ